MSIGCEVNCPLVSLCNKEIENRREEIGSVGTETMDMAEQVEAAVQQYASIEDRAVQRAASSLEDVLPKLGDNAASWIDTKHRRISSVETFKEGAKASCKGPEERKKYWLVGKKVSVCTAQYNKVHYLTIKALSHLPRNFPDTG